MAVEAQQQPIFPTPPRERIVPGSVNIPIARWPSSSSSSSTPTLDDQSCLKIVNEILGLLNDYLARGDGKGVAELFLQQQEDDGTSDDDSSYCCYWRDHLCMSWDLRTLRGRGRIASFVDDKKNNNARGVGLNIGLDVGFDDNKKEGSHHRAPQMVDFRDDGSVSGIQFFVTVKTEYGSGRGVGRLLLLSSSSSKEDNVQQWKIWTLFTSLESLTGHKEPLGINRPLGAEQGDVSVRDRKNWLERRVEECSFEDSDPDVLVVGCGQAGLSVSARLKMLGVPTLAIDTNSSIGDNWRRRYHQLVLHDPVWYDRMPYIPFPKFWPVFTPKDKLADFLQSYAKMLELNIWTDTSVESSKWDATTCRWTVVLKRTTKEGPPSSSYREENSDGRDGGGDSPAITKTELRTLHPRHIVQATGHSGKPNYPSSSASTSNSASSMPPSIPGISTFRGPLICHSSSFPGAKLQPQESQSHKPPPRSAVVVGSSNSALDIAHDYYEKGYRPVTVIQRSPTTVMSSSAVVDLLPGPLYHEGARLGVEDADLLAWSLPSEVFKAVCRDVVIKTRDGGGGGVKDGETLRKLRDVGFLTDDGPDGCGLWFKYLQRGGGYYIDVGTSRLIIEGKIALRSREGGAVEVLDRGVKLGDGTEVEADEVVFATGYENMRTATEEIFGEQVAGKVPTVWGFDEEGEMRTIWRRSGQPGLWLHGGNLAMCRYFSRMVALQIKAQLNGIAAY